MPAARFELESVADMKLSRIDLFPIKSLPSVSVQSAQVLSSGALRYDRKFTLRDGDGRMVNAKRTAEIHLIAAQFNVEAMTVDLWLHNSSAKRESLSLTENCYQIDEWFSDFFGEDIQLVENPDGGFPDDPDATGPTVVSEATLQTVSGWFELDLDERRKRFRTNLEVAGTEPFWEDRLYAHPGVGHRFTSGDVMCAGVKPCQRCGVPPRNSETGETMVGFSSQFSHHREVSLPDWADLSQFDNFYRLATNTLLLRQGRGVLEVGQSIVVDEAKV